MNKSVSTLYLNDNLITDAGAVALCRLLSKTDQATKTSISNISTLFLDKNYIEEKGGKAVAEMLKVNTKLEVLYLSNNCLKNKGIIPIIHSVEDNPYIQYMHLDANQTTSEIQILIKNKLGDKIII